MKKTKMVKGYRETKKKKLTYEDAFADAMPVWRANGKVGELDVQCGTASEAVCAYRVFARLMGASEDPEPTSVTRKSLPVRLVVTAETSRLSQSGLGIAAVR